MVVLEMVVGSVQAPERLLCVYGIYVTNFCDMYLLFLRCLDNLVRLWRSVTPLFPVHGFVDFFPFLGVFHDHPGSVLGRGA